MRKSIKMFLLTKQNYFYFIVPIISFFYVHFACRFGIGISPDSTMYISSAESFVHFGEFRTILKGPEMEYLVHYPPFYSFILAIFYWFTYDFYFSAVLVNAICLASFLILIAHIFKKKLNAIEIILIQLLLLFNLSFSNIYLMSWSEPLFFLLTTISFYFLVRFINENNTKFLMLSASFVALSCITRYIGVTVFLTSFLFLYFNLSQSSIARKLKVLFFYSFISLLPLFFWFLRNKILLGNVSNRAFSFHPISIEYFQELFSNTFSFFFPINFSNTFNITLGVALFVLIILGVSKLIKSSFLHFQLYGIYFWTYFIFLMISNTFFDFTPYYFRTLAPVYMYLIIAFLIYLLKSKRNYISYFYSTLFIYPFLFINYTRDSGIDFSSANCKVPKTIEAIKNLDKKIKCFSNEPDRIYYLTGDLTYWISQYNEKENGKCYMVFFKKGRDYSSDFWIKSKRKWFDVFESDNVVIKSNFE
jgi:hypothetical protein